MEPESTQQLTTFSSGTIEELLEPMSSRPQSVAALRERYIVG